MKRRQKNANLPVTGDSSTMAGVIPDELVEDRGGRSTGPLHCYDGKLQLGDQREKI